MHRATARIGAGFQAQGQQPGGGGAEDEPAGRAGEQQPAGDDDPPRSVRGPGEPAGEVVQRGQREHPAQAADGEARGDHQQLDQPGAAGRRAHGADGRHGRRRGCGLRRVQLVQAGGELQQAGAAVDIGDRDPGVALAQDGDQLGGGQAGAAECEEVAVRRHRHAEQLAPARGQPAGRAGQGAVVLVGVPRVRAQVRERPGQGAAVDLAGGLGRQRIDQCQHRDQRLRQPVEQQRPGGGGVELPVGDQVADQQLAAGGGPADGRGGRPDPGQRLQRGVDLAQLDPAAGQLDLLVGAADEDQAGRIGLHQVATAVDPGAAQPGVRAELLGVLGRVQVARGADAADQQLAGLVPGDRLALAVDDGDLPAGQRRADPHRLPGRQQGRAGHHGGLGGAVGVPELAVRCGQPVDQLGRAGLAADDQQPDPLQALDRPERQQGRHGGDHGDPALHQPGPEVGAGLDQRARRRDQAGGVPPGEPDLLAGGVEGHREAGQHPVAGAERVRPQEEPGFGVDEGGRRAVADRDALGAAGGAGGEDDPGVVVGRRTGRVAAGAHGGAGRNRLVGADHGADARVGPDQLGPLVGVVRVHRDVRGAGAQHGEDGDIEVGGPGRDPDADPVAPADPGGGQPAGQPVGGGQQRAVVQDDPAGVERRGQRAGTGGRLQDVDQGSDRRCVLDRPYRTGPRSDALPGRYALQGRLVLHCFAAPLLSTDGSRHGGKAPVTGRLHPCAPNGA
ncbi:hypothetical protein P3T34_005473 [Kitasatospora sp. MAP12-44]|nr:hypothetical protein [Kitasatospora sp. MAP12-44]